MANISDDTICAISTPPGVGGIAVIRISGPRAIEIADRLWHGKALDTAPSHTARFGTIEDPDTHQTLDEAVATVFRAPASFTGENVVELSVHGSLWIQNRLIQILIHAGCRLAQPGEFTRRAFASGKLDLAEAEAIADVIASTSRASHRVAMSQMRGQFSRRLSDLRDKLLELASLLELELDFAEEHVEFADRAKLLELSEQTRNEVCRLADSFATGDAIRRGIPVAIIGKPNVGKSSILNRLLNDNRAIVSDIPGTTRDTIEDTADINGYTFRFIDTAGLRHTADTVESLGIERARLKASQARIILWVIDPAGIAENQLTSDTISGHIIDGAIEIASIKQPDTSLILVLNKSDLISDKTAALSAITQALSDPLHRESDYAASDSGNRQPSPTPSGAT
ncbi:MAG: tRNA uridine-5-carboxymethylaminomethyl(34) synthesis GTPase MnmE, partial [Muribaculaceae bacterium]|nr:tRNA uridine-5-carboxymethylaminomethyl(34) synthesis GTPase MnmE [Muribaculaceae bacterium]